jgi:acetyltransferase-like isoleucine patch superfamily enzyme
MGDYSIIDDFCYISTEIILDKFVHIASNCTIAGGRDSYFSCGKFGGLASGVRVFCTSDDFVNSIAVTLPKEFNSIKNYMLRGDVVLDNFVTVGANSVIMPHVYIPEGTVIGACSFVPSGMKLKAWSVYCGYPKIRLVKERNKENVLSQVKQIEERL